MQALLGGPAAPALPGLAGGAQWLRDFGASCARVVAQAIAQVALHIALGLAPCAEPAKVSCECTCTPCPGPPEARKVEESPWLLVLLGAVLGGVAVLAAQSLRTPAVPPQARRLSTSSSESSPEPLKVRVHYGRDPYGKIPSC